MITRALGHLPPPQAYFSGRGIAVLSGVSLYVLQSYTLIQLIYTVFLWIKYSFHSIDFAHCQCFDGACDRRLGPVAKRALTAPIYYI